MNPRSKWFGLWIALAAIITVLVGLVYVTAQNVLRQSANDPQIEITQEIRDAISQGAPPEQIIPPTAAGTDLKNSLGAFAAIYDKDGNPIGSSAKLNGQDPVPPKSVFDKAKETGRNSFTWQPENDVRVAAVVIPTKSGEDDVYILSGKNLREVDDRIQDILSYSLIAWILLLLLGAVAARALTALVNNSPAIIERDTEVVVIESTEAPTQTEIRP